MSGAELAERSTERAPGRTHKRTGIPTMKHSIFQKIMHFAAPGGSFARPRLLRRFSILALCLPLLAACASTPAARDKLIEQRAQARWDALLARDYETAYSYLSPGYRSTTSVTDFEIGVRARRVQYISAEYRSHSCEEAVCTVQIMVGYRVVRPVVGLPEWKSTSLVEERWINSDGGWWFLPEK